MAPLHSWRAKALLQQVLSHAPGGTKLNYLLQTRVTHGLPISDAKLRSVPATARLHVAALECHGSSALPEAVFFEFGAGWDLRLPIVLYALGVRHQIVIDLAPLARAALFQDVIHRIEGLDELIDEEREMIRGVAARTATMRSLADKTEELGIEYRAPSDARATGLPGGSVDCVTSTSTMEHIAPDDISQILRECRRILRPGGVLSMVIDYSDHYSHFDPSITPYNFLRFSSRQWRLYNSALQFQNRLRHSQYLEIIEGTGLEVVEVVPDPVPEDRRRLLEQVPLASEFRRFDEANLAITSARFVLREPCPGGVPRT